MYPPSGNDYSRLPTHDDPESAHASHYRKPAWRTSFFRTAYRPRPFFVIALLIIGTLLSFSVFVNQGSSTPTVKPPAHTPSMKNLTFDEEAKPSWLLTPPTTPLKLRVAVICRPKEFYLRKTIRETIFKGVRKSDVEFDFRFFVGRPPGDDADEIVEAVKLEVEEYGDIGLLEDLEDHRISQKRWEAIKWGGSVPRESYDWFLTIDGDTFVRLAALSRRTSNLVREKNLNPQNQSVLIGRLGPGYTYFENTVLDEKNENYEEDLHIRGPWYFYPIGVGYMMSSFLMHTLLAMDPPPPHHIHYPGDDVMIGSWVFGLKYFPDTSVLFERLAPEPSSTPGAPAPEPKWEPYHPRPFYPYPIETELIDEKNEQVWHDWSWNRTVYEAPFSWRSVAMHHVYPPDMKAFRELAEIKDEWE